MLERILRIHLFIIGVLLLCLALQAYAVPSGVSVNIEYEDEPLADVLQRVSAVSGFSIVLKGQMAQTPVSGKIENLPLDEALRNILKRFNYTIVWDEKIRKILITVYDSSLEEGSGKSLPAIGGHRDPVQVSPEMIPPSNDRNDRAVPTRQSDRRDGTISGEGVRFIQGTRTTGQ